MTTAPTAPAGFQTGFQTGFPVRPGLVVEAAHAGDVRTAVADAAARGLPVHVHATGHGLPGAVEAEVLAPLALGRSLNFSFGGGDRTEGFHDARTQQRLAGLVSRHDPASLFGGSYGISPGGR